MKQLFIILFYLILALPLYSMDYQEKISASIVDVGSKKTQVILDRGFEDGVEVGDVIKIISEEETLLIGIAVAIYIRPELSEWRFYSTYRPKLLFPNNKVTMESLYGPKKPYFSSLVKWQEESELKKIYLEEREKFLQSEAKDFNSKQNALYEKYQLLNYKEFSIPDFNFGFNASPITFRSPNRDRTLSYGLDLKNIEQENYVYVGQYKYTGSSYTYNADRNKYSSSTYWFSQSLDKKRWFSNFDYTSLFQYKKERTGTLYPVIFQFSLAPAGIKYSFLPFSKVTKLSLSYMPLMEFYSADKKEITGPYSFNTIKVKDTYFRHSLSLEIKIVFSETLQLEDNFSYRPYHDIFQNKYDFDNCDLKNSMMLRYEAYPRISISYINNLSWDIRKKRNLQTASTEWENGFYIQYSIDWTKRKI